MAKSYNGDDKMKIIKTKKDDEFLKISLDYAIVWTEDASFYDVDSIDIYEDKVDIKVEDNIVGEIRWALADDFYLVEINSPVVDVKDIIREYFPS